MKQAVVLAAVLVLALASRVRPAAVSWTAGSSGDWWTGSNWSSGSAPAAGDDVTIAFASPGDEVTLDTAPPPSLTSITVSGPGQLRVQQDTLVTGTLTVLSNAAVHMEAGAVVTADVLAASSGNATLAGSASLVLLSNATSTLRHLVASGASIAVHGRLDVTGAAQLGSSSVTLDLATSWSELQLFGTTTCSTPLQQSQYIQYWAGSGSIINHGSVEWRVVRTRSASGQIPRIINMPGASWLFAPSYAGTSDMNIVSAPASMTPYFINRGVFTVASDNTAQVNVNWPFVSESGSEIHVQGRVQARFGMLTSHAVMFEAQAGTMISVEGNATMTLDSDGARIADGVALSVAGTIGADGSGRDAYIDITPSIAVHRVLVTGGTALHVAGAVTADSVSLQATGQLDLAASAGSTNVLGDVDMRGTLTSTARTNITGDLVLSSQTSVLSVPGAASELHLFGTTTCSTPLQQSQYIQYWAGSGSIINHGSVEWRVVRTRSASGQIPRIINMPGASWLFAPSYAGTSDMNIVSAPASMTPYFINRGVFTVASDNTAQVNVNWPFVSESGSEIHVQGRVQARFGMLTSHAVMFEAQAGTMISVEGNATMTLDSDGARIADGVALSVAGTIGADGSGRDAYIDITPSIAVHRVLVTGGTALHIAGAVTATHTDILFGGQLDLAAVAPSVHVLTALTFDSGTLTVHARADVTSAFQFGPGRATLSLPDAADSQLHLHGTTVATGALQQSGYHKLLHGPGTLTNHGDVVWSVVRAYVPVGMPVMRIVNAAGATWRYDLDNASSLQLAVHPASSSASFVNYGTIMAARPATSASQLVEVFATLANHGHIVVAAGTTLQFGQTSPPYQTFRSLAGSSISVDANSTLDVATVFGAIEHGTAVSINGTLACTGYGRELDVQVQDALALGGIVMTGDSVLRVQTPLLSVRGTTSLSVGELHLNASSPAAHHSLADVALDHGATLRLRRRANITGTLALRDSQSHVRLDAADAELHVLASMTATATTSGNLGTKYLYGPGTLVNHGQVFWSVQTCYMADARIINAAGATWTFVDTTVDQQMVLDADAGGGFINDGSMVVEEDDVTVQLRVDVNITGTVSVADGAVLHVGAVDRTVFAPGSSTSVGADAVLQIGAGTTVIAAGAVISAPDARITFTGYGASQVDVPLDVDQLLVLAHTLDTFAPVTAVNASVQSSAGVWHMHGCSSSADSTVATLDMVSGALRVNGTLRIHDDMLLNDGGDSTLIIDGVDSRVINHGRSSSVAAQSASDDKIVRGTGRLINAADAVLRLDGAELLLDDTLRVDNAGVIRVTADVGYTAVLRDLAMRISTVLTNTGTIHFDAPSAGAFDWAVATDAGAGTIIAPEWYEQEISAPLRLGGGGTLIAPIDAAGADADSVAGSIAVVNGWAHISGALAVHLRFSDRFLDEPPDAGEVTVVRATITTDADAQVSIRPERDDVECSEIKVDQTSSSITASWTRCVVVFRIFGLTVVQAGLALGGLLFSMGAISYILLQRRAEARLRRRDASKKATSKGADGIEASILHD